jgi:hypothetical protein
MALQAANKIAACERMIHMKLTKLMAIVTLLFLAISTVASAQSLGDYARSVRKNKPDTTASAHVYDNDNLPSNDGLSIVGQAPDPKSAQPAPGATDPAAAAADAKKTADECKQKFDSQKQKIDSLNHELDLEQREYRLRAAAYYGDAGTRLRDSAQWTKDDAQYKSDIDSKQKAVDDARKELNDMQEEARKEGIKEKDADKSADANNANK